MWLKFLLPDRFRAEALATSVSSASDTLPLPEAVPIQRDFSLSRVWHTLLRGGLVLAGVLSATLGLKGFLLPNEFIDGGVTGISMLASQVIGVPLSVLIILINIPFIVLGYFQLGPKTAFKTMAAILALAVALLVISLPPLTHDKLLIAVFGGFFLGAGVGLAMRGGSVLDGTEILAVYLSRKVPGSIGDTVLLINLFIFGTAAWLLSVETALYSILVYLSAAKTVDFVLVGVEEYTGLTIISFHSTEIRQMITDKMHRGATVYECTQGYGSHGHQQLKVEAIFTIITRLEVMRLTSEVRRIDPHAFLFTQSVNETKGGLIKPRALH